jgi:hypothetical protein
MARKKRGKFTRDFKLEAVRKVIVDDRETGATLYFPLSGLNPLPEVDLGQIKLTNRLGPCFHSRYFLCDSPRGHQIEAPCRDMAIW